MNVRLPSLSGLRAFEAAARHMSFTRAAEELHVTQTAISHQIRRLEEQLGLPLFRRQGRAIALTAEAEAYLPAVRAAFEDLRRATGRLLSPAEGRQLTVSTTSSFAVKWLVPKLAKFQALHPEIEVRITTSSALVDFAREEVDLAIRYGYGAWRGLDAVWLMNEDVFPVCAPSLVEAGEGLRRPEDLARQTLLHVGRYAEDWRTWLTAAGLPQLKGARDLEFDLSMLAIQAAIEGVGVALGRTVFVQDDLAAGRLVRPFTTSLHSDAGYYVVAPREHAQRPKIRAFREWLQAEVAASREFGFEL